MKKSYTCLLGTAMLLVPSLGLAQSVLSPRTAIVLSKSTPRMISGTDAANRDMTAFITIDPTRTSWQTLGLMPMVEQGNTATVRVSLDRLRNLATAEGVEYVQLTAGANLALNNARAEAGVDDVHNGVSLPQSYTGKGVVVGIVDTGFDYLHSAFRNPTDGSLRIKSVWEQNKSAKLDGAVAPEKFGYGVELNTPELIAQAQADRSDLSHGTHVAGIAAGSDDYKDGAYVGVAPDADIVIVAADMENFSSADIANGVQYIYDYAEKVGKPCVVNLSICNHEGPHDGTSTFDVLTSEMQGPGRLLVGAAGNDRTKKFHVARKFESADDAPLKTLVDYSLGMYSTGSTIEIWGEKDSEFTVELSLYGVKSKKVISSTVVYPAEGVTEVSFGKYATGSYKAASEVSPLNGKPHITLSAELTNVRKDYYVAITVTPKSKGQVDIWTNPDYLILGARRVEGFSEPDASSSTICEIGGTGKRIVSVGSYNTYLNSDYAPDPSASADDVVGGLSYFSSYGPTADGRIKPDVTAPGNLILSAVSNFDSSYGLKVVDKKYKYDRQNLYAYKNGTSMASPFVVGVVATWLQAYPELTPEQLHEIIEATGRKDEFSSTAPDNNWGFGKINPMDGLKKCIELQETGIESVDTPFDGSIKIEDGNITVNFPRNTRAVVSVADLAGNTVMNRDLGNMTAGETVSVPMPSVAKGVYVLTVKNDAYAKSYKYVCR